MRRLVLVAAVACGGADTPHPLPPSPGQPPADAALAPLALDAAPIAVAAAPPPPPEVWLRGSTHVHARPSGDSSTPIPDVIRWYESRGYDFIVLSDHNKVSEVEAGTSTAGQVFVRNPERGLIVLAGSELTHNPVGCLPPGDASNKCRIHVNVLGATARPEGKIDWPDRTTRDRVAKYESALVAARALGGIAQLNHPQTFWGMTPDVLVEIAGRGIRLVEIWNMQYLKWDKGDATHPSTEELWDQALARGATLWAVAADDAHDYRADGKGKYPAGGAWIVVRAHRDPRAILDAIAGGRFYASTGVELERAEVVGAELVIEVAKATSQSHQIRWIENGVSVASVTGSSARRALPAQGYLRAVVVRDDGARAWVQPARR